jgi:hypothetical protein
MPKDQRLYMTFPIEMPEHPKIKPLSDAAFRVIIEINAYSRRLGLDGRIPVNVAKAMWRPRALAELESNHPERPTLTVEGDVYVIRDYAEHQLTTQAIEELREKRSESGRKGGKAKASAVASAKANAKQTGSKPLPESESESEIETSDTQLLDPVSLELDAREFTAEEIEGFRKALDGFCELDDLGTATLVTLLMEASPRPVANVVGYIVRCVQRSPQKVKALAVEAERQAARVRLAVAS